jgi:hypothetical protein
MTKNTAQIITFEVFGGMFGNVTRVSILGTVLCEMNLGKALELSKSEAWFIKERYILNRLHR